MIRYAVLISIGVFALISSANAVNVYHLVSKRKCHHAKVRHASGSGKTCLRYYGGPKGGLWPGPC
jgi:hypothetical protein